MLTWLDVHGATLAGLAFGVTAWTALTLAVVSLGSWGLASVINEVHRLMMELAERKRQAFLQRMKDVDRILR